MFVITVLYTLDELSIFKSFAKRDVCDAELGSVTDVLVSSTGVMCLTLLILEIESLE